MYVVHFLLKEALSLDYLWMTPILPHFMFGRWGVISAAKPKNIYEWRVLNASEVLNNLLRSMLLEIPQYGGKITFSRHNQVQVGGHYNISMYAKAFLLATESEAVNDDLAGRGADEDWQPLYYTYCYGIWVALLCYFEPLHLITWFGVTDPRDSVSGGTINPARSSAPEL